MALIRLICYPPYLVLECWLEIVNSNELETITQAEIYESAKILQDLAKVKTTYTFSSKTVYFADSNKRDF